MSHLGLTYFLCPGYLREDLRPFPRNVKSLHGCIVVLVQVEVTSGKNSAISLQDFLSISARNNGLSIKIAGVEACGGLSEAALVASSPNSLCRVSRYSLRLIEVDTRSPISSAAIVRQPSC